MGISLVSMLVLVNLVIVSCSKTDMKQSSPIVEASQAGKAERADGDVATDWYRLQFSIMKERNSSFNGVYYAYFGVGLWETVRPGVRNSRSFYGQLRTMPMMPEPEKNSGYNYVVSANTFMAELTRKMFSGLTDANNQAINDLESKYNAQESPDQNSEVFARSQAWGKKMAEATYNWYKTDDLVISSAGYIVPTGNPAFWIPTPPAFLATPVNAFFGKATTLVASIAPIRAHPFPFAYSEDPNSDFYKMERQVYDKSKVLTDAEKATAFYWVDQGNGTAYTPPGHDFFVLTQCIEQENATLDVTAEAYAKAGIAERDGSIVIFGSKYITNLIRPISYIRRVIDPAWNAQFSTPPHPEYPAAHAGGTGSVMYTAATVLGDNVPVTDRSHEFLGYPARHYPNLGSVAEEAGISRNYAGIHYLISITEGIDCAKRVAAEIAKIKVRD